MRNTGVIAYGLLGLPLAFAALPVYVHVPHYYAETAGLDLTLLGAILLGARLIDAGIDPWFGSLADRVPRPTMIAVALLPFAAGFVALFNPPANHVGPWLIGSLALTYAGFSAATVAYQAWGADVGVTASSRTRLTAAREGFGLTGVVLAAALPGVLAPDFATGVERLSWVLPPLLLAVILVTFSLVAGRQSSSMETQPWWHASRNALGDPAFRRLLLIFVANGIASALPATLFLFFVADVLGEDSASGPLLATYFIAGAASVALWTKLAARLGRVAAWLIAMMLAMISFAGTVMLGDGDVWPFAAICLASGLALGADLVLPAAIAADIGERRRQAGACFGLWNFVGKLNLALAAGLSLPLLATLGYSPGERSAVAALVFAYACLPLAFKAVAAYLLWQWRAYLETDQ